MNSTAKSELKQDFQRKEHANQIDTGAAQLNNHSYDIHFYCGIEVDPTVSIPEAWAGFTQALLRRSQAERAAGQRIHSMINNLLVQGAKEITVAWNNTNNAFSLRIAELFDAKSKIQCRMGGF